jgi:hypothetical protein
MLGLRLLGEHPVEGQITLRLALNDGLVYEDRKAGIAEQLSSASASEALKNIDTPSQSSTPSMQNVTKRLAEPDMCKPPARRCFARRLVTNRRPRIAGE